MLPREIAALQELKQLKLDSNPFTQLPPLDSLKALEMLSISNDTVLSEIPSLPPSLKHLYAYNANNLRSIPKALRNCEQLKTLIVTNAHIDFAPSWIFELKKLNWLTLDGNRITSIPPVINIPELEYLNLDNNKIDSIPFSLFTLPKLKTLSINNNPVKHIPKAILQAGALKYFNIEKTRIASEEYTGIRIETANKSIIITADDKLKLLAYDRNRPCYSDDDSLLFNYEIFTKTEVPPRFNENTNDKIDFFNRSLLFPYIDSTGYKDQPFSDTVIVKFVVLPYGGITKVTTLVAKLKQTKQEALRLLKLSCTGWKPAVTGSRSVKAWCYTRFIFTQFYSGGIIQKKLSVQVIPQYP
ncbi:hypothetical protein NIASO_08560 [Niabella soli DSM 19437]|uniref:Uncharacterized protein n=2 Tax=Niabella TaxID=379899 RepID=W0F7P5_9BACT|nr:hypothetical protein NIASO_08560 [Niabella soli DSM 19437]